MKEITRNHDTRQYFSAVFEIVSAAFQKRLQPQTHQKSVYVSREA